MEYEESIYNLIPKEQYAPPKPKRFKSRHPHDLPPTGSTICLGTTSMPRIANLGGEYQLRGGSHEPRGASLTLGKPRGSLKPSTTNFVKKGTMKLPEGKFFFF